MKTSVRNAVVVILSLGLVVLSLGGVGAGTQPKQQPEAKPPVIPDCSALVLVKEASEFIQEWQAKPRRREEFVLGELAIVRSSALMIALVAQNRMVSPGADARRFATLRDAALKLVAEAQKEPCNFDEVRKLADVLRRFPDIPANRDASLTPVRLKGTFTHDEVAILFGGCGVGNKTHRTEFHLSKFARQKTPYTAEQADKIELLAYKVALIGELLREMDDFLPERRKGERPEWVRLAGEVHQNAWELAATARGQDSDDQRRAARKLNNACISCHEKFRDCAE